MNRALLPVIGLAMAIGSCSARQTTPSHFAVESHVGGEEKVSTVRHRISADRVAIWTNPNMTCTARADGGDVLVDCTAEGRAPGTTVRAQTVVACGRHTSRDTSLYLFLAVTDIWAANNNLHMWCE
jgi:hypothetical protein